MSTVCGTGSGNFPQPGDPELNGSILSVVPAFGGIDIFWTYPALNAHAVAHTFLYRSSNADPATKVKLRTVTGDSHYDKVDPSQGITYYYWIQIVSVNGTVGDMIGPASAMARPTIEQMLNILTGKINDGALATSLKNELQRIDSLNSDLQSETASRLSQYDDLMVDIGVYQDEANATATLLASEVNRLDSSDTAQISQINVLGAKTDDNSVLLTSEQTARADADEALGSRIDTIQASNTNTYYEETAPDPVVVSLNENDIWVDISEPADGSPPDYNVYQWIGGAWLPVVGNTLAGAFAAVEAEQLARVNRDGQIAQSVETLETSLGRKSRTFFQASEPVAENVGDLWIDTDDNNKLHRWDGTGWVDGWDSRILTALENAAIADAKAVSASDAAAAAEAHATAEATAAEVSAKAYADGEASAAELAAIAAAEAYADARQTESLAYSDGVATGAEEAAIDAANAYADQKKLEAQAYTDGEVTASEQAAINAAKAYADQKKVEALAYSDGIVTTSEQAAIDAAATYTDAQRVLAETTAAAYADGEVSEAEARAIAAAQQKADTAEANASALADAAQADADIGKTRNQVFREGPSEPAAENIGDLWFDSSDGDQGHQWDGEAWVPLNLYTGNQVNAAIEDNNASMIGYCEIGGSPDSSYQDPVSCSAAGGNWLPATPLADAVRKVQVNDGAGSATVQQKMTAYKNELGVLSSQWTAQVQVDTESGDAIFGGFALGVDSEAETVEAGFDVDTFWVGKLGQKNYPFIIEGGEVFIKEAVMGKLTFESISSEDGSLLTTPAEYDLNGNVITPGKLKADYIDADSLIVEYGNINNVDIKTADIQTGAITNAKISDGEITTAKIGEAQVDTLNIRSNAVTVPDVGFAYNVNLSGTGWQRIVRVPYTHGHSESLPVLIRGMALSPYTLHTDFVSPNRIYIDGVNVGNDAINYTLSPGLHNIDLYVYRLNSNFSIVIKSAFLSILGVKR